MQPAADRLTAVLDALLLADVKLPVVANATAAPNMDKDQVKPLLVTQVCAPVLWEQSVSAMAAQGVSRFVEIGPGKVLSGLVKRITKEVETANIGDLESLKAQQG
jgi:[acyl-carrier-protein] S-malonyltransferase